MKVKGIFNIMGKGWVLACEGDFEKLHIGDEVEVKDKDILFLISGYGVIPGHKNIELILSPNDSVKEFVEIGDELIFDSKLSSL